MGTAADSDGATEAGALAVAVGPVEGDGDTWAMDGLGVALAPPRMPPANRMARTATTATAAMRIAGPALPESAPEPVACVVTIGWRSTGDSSVAQFRQKTRSGGFTVPQFGQTIPLGGGGGGGPDWGSGPAGCPCLSRSPRRPASGSGSVWVGRLLGARLGVLLARPLEESAARAAEARPGLVLEIHRLCK